MVLNDLHQYSQFWTLCHVGLVEILKLSGERTPEHTLERFASRRQVEFSVNLSKAKNDFLIAQPALVMTIIKPPARDVDRQLTPDEAAPTFRKKPTSSSRNCRTYGISITT